MTETCSHRMTRGHYLFTAGKFLAFLEDRQIRALEQADGTARSARPPRWKREPALLAWLDSL